MLLLSNNLDFSFHKKGQNSKKENTLLIIGGIQGDEPGGFNAASLIVTKYKFTKGNVWVVPNLNFRSIIKRSRGVYGDMNRKFAALPKNDPEYNTVSNIKKIITNPQVDLILNLHDGSGFHREKYIDKLRNPYRWGQSTIIDQKFLYNKNNELVKFGNLEEIGRFVVNRVNNNLVDKEHYFSLKNTKTREGDLAMAKSLTYFAISKKKPAFGVEGSKSFLTYMRTYYHLLAVESYMKYMGIEFERDFELSPLGVKVAINNSNLEVDINNKIPLKVAKARRILKYVPLEKNADVAFNSNNPLVAVVDNKVYYGNRRMTILQPQYFEYDNSIDKVEMLVDGIEQKVKIGSVVNVKKSFKVKPINGYRVNVIGYTNKNKKNEVDVLINKSAIQKHFSVDRLGKSYRVEIYKKNKFTGMILVNFSSSLQPKNTATLALNEK